MNTEAYLVFKPVEPVWIPILCHMQLVHAH